MIDYVVIFLCLLATFVHGFFWGHFFGKRDAERQQP